MKITEIKFGNLGKDYTLNTKNGFYKLWTSGRPEVARSIDGDLATIAHKMTAVVEGFTPTTADTQDILSMLQLMAD